MHSFAQQIVRDICGTPRPFIIWDDAVIAEFNQMIAALQKQENPEPSGLTVRPRFWTPPPDFLDGGFNREWRPSDIAEDMQPLKTELPVQGLDRSHIERFAHRIKQLIPPEGRYFSADELLFSWISEPEVWQYIPIFLVPEADYLDEMFGISSADDVRTSQYRVSLHQLRQSQRYKQRAAGILRRQELGQMTKEPVRFDQITERLESQSRMFQELTYHPQRHRPDRMLSLLYQAAGWSDGQSSYAYAFDMWGYLLTLGDVPGRQTTTRQSDADALVIFHPTTQRWHHIEDKLHLLIRIYDRTDSSGNPVFPNALAVEKQYEELIDLIDRNLTEAAALMERVYPGVSYRPAEKDSAITVEQLLPLLQSPENQQNQAMIRRAAISYYYTVKKLRREIEAAYLALYDNGRSLRFVPIRSPLSLELGSSQNNFGVQPWASAQMILGSGEPFVKRFFDPQDGTTVLGQPPTPADETGETDEAVAPTTVPAPDEASVSDPNGAKTLTDETGKASPAITGEEPLTDTHIAPGEQSLVEQLFQPPGTTDWLLQTHLEERTVMENLRAGWRTLFNSYTASVNGYKTIDFALKANELHNAVYLAAMQVETHRELLVDEDNKRMVEQFSKTSYPGAGSSMKKLLAEYRYDRLHPFYWMWVFALLAVFLNGSAYVVSIVQRERVSGVSRSIAIHSTVQGGKEEATELQDYTNTFEEWLFIGSVVMLTLSMLIAFIGAVMRASITGWAPVTNMYETIVMMALATAMIGVWYALYPLLHPALKLAWDYSKFPGIGTFLELYAAVKVQKSVSSSETAGEAAMREAAADFGVPGSAAFREHSALTQQQESEMFESQRRVRTAQRKIVWQCLLAVPRLILTFILFYAIVLLANEGGDVADQGWIAAAANLFATSDAVDWLAVVVSVVIMVWIVPHMLLTLLMIPVVLLCPAWIAAEQGIRSFESVFIVEQAQLPTANRTGRPRSELGKVFHGEGQNILTQNNTSGAAWLKQARNAALDRKLFIAIAATIVFAAGFAAGFNRAEFNPDIRPIAAVLRSNFWLTVHVAAFIVGYAAAFIAWGMAAVSLGYVVFGRYRRTEPALEGQKTQILLPETCQLFSPVIERLIRIALLLLIAGTVLGGRWADYSWGRFWSWDPKEVWALITIIVFVIVFHGKIARYYGAIGVTVGALFASIAVIITWYGINFVFKGSVHAYGGGAASNATSFLIVFVMANILWGTLALLRYGAEVYGNETNE